MKQLLTLAIVISISIILAFAIPVTTANAITEGTAVIFLISSDDIQPTPPNTLQEGLTFAGKPSTSIDTTGCAAGTHPVQRATLVDLQGPSGSVDVIVLSGTDPIPAGTELRNLTPIPPSCTIDGVIYDKFFGEAHTPNPSDD